MTKVKPQIPMEITLMEALSKWREKGYKNYRVTTQPHNQSGIQGKIIAIEFKKGKDEKIMPVFIDNKNKKKQKRIVKLFEGAALTMNKI